MDISISGLGLRVAKADFHAALKPGASTKIHMQIPSAEINVSGTVLSAFKADEFYRLSIRFAQDISQRSLIFKYLIDRRHEIEEEVRLQFQKYLDSGNWSCNHWIALEQVTGYKKWMKEENIHVNIWSSSGE